MSSNAQVSLDYEYFYRLEDEPALESALVLLESELGGRRHAVRGAGNGLAINIIPILEILISVVVAWIAKPMLQRYVEGLVSADELKDLGQRHRSALLSLLGRFRTSVGGVLPKLSKILTLGLPVKAVQKPEKAITLKFRLSPVNLWVVLNHTGTTADLLEALPDGISRTLQALADGVVPHYTEHAQLYFDAHKQDWRYVLITKIVPRRDIEILSELQFSGYVDLTTSEFVEVHSVDELKAVLSPSPLDRWKFLADIFYEES